MKLSEEEKLDRKKRWDESIDISKLHEEGYSLPSLAGLQKGQDVDFGYDIKYVCKECGFQTPNPYNFSRVQRSGCTSIFVLLIVVTAALGIFIGGIVNI